MKKFVISIGALIILIFAAIIIFSNNHDSDSAITKVNGTEVRELLAKDDNAFFIDVRTEAEHNDDGIEGSINIRVDQIQSTFERADINKNTSIIVYCRSGNRSEQAARTLEELGYKNIYDMGSINNWYK